MKKNTNQFNGSHADRINNGGGVSSEGSLCSH